MVRIPQGARISVSCECGVLSLRWTDPSSRVVHLVCFIECDKLKQKTFTPTMSKQTEVKLKKERKKERKTSDKKGIDSYKYSKRQGLNMRPS